MSEDDEPIAAAAPVDSPFPLTVVYCGICGVPPEYCPYGPDWERCRVWITDNCPDLMPSEAKGVPRVAEAAPAPTDAGDGAGTLSLPCTVVKVCMRPVVASCGGSSVRVHPRVRTVARACVAWLRPSPPREPTRSVLTCGHARVAPAAARVAFWCLRFERI